MMADPTTQNAKLPRYRLSIEDYHQMAKHGIFAEDTRIELLEGELIQMPPIGEAHAGQTRQLNHLFAQAAAGQALVDVQNPLALDQCSEPQPDLMLLKFRADFYKTAKPTPQDVLLLIEVADTSLHYDKNIKIPLYAKHAIPEVWLINLPQQCVEIYRQPTKQGYRHIWLPENQETIAPELLPEVHIEIAGLW